jgi:hypothetical protein
MNMYGGVEVQPHSFLTSALDGSEYSASRPGRITPAERAPGTHWIRGWVGPRASLDTAGAKGKRTFIFPAGTGRPARSLVTVLTELPRLLVFQCYTPAPNYTKVCQRFPSVRFSNNFVCGSSFLYACYLPIQNYLYIYMYINILRKVQTMTLLIQKFSTYSCCYLPPYFQIFSSTNFTPL